MRMGMVVDRDCHGPDQRVESVREAHATRGYGEWNGGGRGLPRAWVGSDTRQGGEWNGGDRGLPRAWVGSDTREEGSWNGGGRGLSRPWLGRGKGKEGHGTASCSWSHEAGRLVARAPRLEAGLAPSTPPQPAGVSLPAPLRPGALDPTTRWRGDFGPQRTSPPPAHCVIGAGRRQASEETAEHGAPAPLGPSPAL